ncbi:hypothetical protein UA08_05167 [Talaromyces atroroseus]|uniref:Uncharacterized protein n=1 Tax=Talaromyces atroroseus TaxID=1441469 RepID=A0A225AR26_TALAT|nr:hypothetical protein UA08_05167 [Talaromyces atroroseus]OKL59718.1 hypothetical protein UA08_05167 [Talaromyces atroroseus]
MATPSSSSTNKGETRPNHNTMSTQGGASAVPTAANNAGGGSGWGDKSFTKGGGGQEGEDTNGPCVSGDHSFARHAPGSSHGVSAKLSNLVHT